MPPSVCSPWMMIESCWLRDTSRSSQDLTLKKYFDISWRLGTSDDPQTCSSADLPRTFCSWKWIHKMLSARAERRRWPGSWPTERPQACPPKYIWGVSFARDGIAWLEIHRQDMPIWSNIYHWADEFSRRCVSSRECKLQHSHIEPPSNSGAAFRAKMPWYLFQGVHQDTPTMMFAHSLAINCHLKMLRSSAAPVGRGWIWRSMQNHQQFWRHKSNKLSVHCFNVSPFVFNVSLMGLVGG